MPKSAKRKLPTAFPVNSFPFHSHIFNSFQITAASLFLLSSLFCICLRLRYNIMNYCDSCNNSVQIRGDVDVFILSDLKVFHTESITNLHAGNINLDLVNQICRECFVCYFF